MFMQIQSKLLPSIIKPLMILSPFCSLLWNYLGTSLFFHMGFEILPLILSRAYLRVVFSTLCGLMNLGYGVGNLTDIHMLLILEKSFCTLVSICSVNTLRAFLATYVSMWHQAKKAPNQTVDF